jgi:hypothetical protein
MGEIAHGVDNAGNAMEAFEGLFDGAGRFGDEEIQFALAEGLFEFGGEFRGGGILLDSAEEALVLAEDGNNLGEGLLEETDVVADVLRRSVDLMGDAGGEPADGFEFLGVAELEFHHAPFLLGLFLFHDFALQ